MEAKTQDYGSIGWAINHLRHGHQMRRNIWPVGVYVALDAGTSLIKLFGPAIPEGTLFESGNADLLTTDWAMLNPVPPGVTSAP